MNAIIAGTYMLLGGLVVLLATVLLLSGRKQQDVEFSDTLLAHDELEKHAVDVARSHVAGRNVRNLKWLLRRMNENFEFISRVYRSLSTDIKAVFPTAPAAEWLLDNFYMIEEQARLIRKNLPRGNYGKLPVLKSGYLRGYPRVYAIALELVSHTDGRIDEKVIVSFLNAYQSQCLLSMGELWAVALMLRIAMIENIRNLSEKIMVSQQEWHHAEKFAAYVTTAEKSDNEIYEYLEEQLGSRRDIGFSFTEHFLQKLRKAGKGVSAAVSWLDGRLVEENLNTETVTAMEHQLQASRQVSMGNAITGLKLVSDIDWADIFEQLSQVERILRQDPAGVYTEMDFASRDFYRHEVEKLSRVYNTSEINIARKAVECAQDTANPQTGSHSLNHVGYYLAGKGRKCLMDRLGTRYNGRRKLLGVFGRYPVLLYVGGILLLTSFITAYFTYYAGIHELRRDFTISLAAILVTLIPASELSLLLINTILSHVVKPSMLPKLELKNGITAGLRTLVIIPTLLPDEKRVRELLQQLELFYLGNRDENLFFALAGDFRDSGEKHRDEDAKILETAVSGIRELNSRYGGGSKKIFALFHRERVFDEKQGKWMGWERKRGAVTELCRLLRNGTRTGFTTVEADLEELRKVRYVITLDADTYLPMGAAKRLIGTISHPLNKAVVDEDRGIVTGGYGLLQPRISVSVQAANNTLFTRIFAGQGGIDPYTTAVSDIYQDLFGEGIFAGKGIFDIDIFLRTLDDRIPDNAILSHDLLEGCHVRSGLVTDIELVDGYPSKYSSFSMRQHRWVRGDWQLLPWLASAVRNRQGALIPNPLSSLSKWKIADNLRRSLLYPSLFLLILLGSGILPGSTVGWYVLALAAAFSPMLVHLLNLFLSGRTGTAKIHRNSTIITGFKASFYQSVLLFSFIPYQAYLMADAILRTLGRIFITHRNLLEWVTAADVESSLKNDLKSFWRRMWFSAPAALAVLAAGLVQGGRSMVLPLLTAILWLASPAAAIHISKPVRRGSKPLAKQELLRLRRLARQTWRYFEDFAVREDNYMPPDNYQEYPPKGAAHRTSPTNIGLLLISVLTARDLGYSGALETVERLDHILSGIEKMEKWKGHLYNWYNTITLDTLRPLYVSTVDSGNYAGCLMVLRQGLMEYLRRPPAGMFMAEGLSDTFHLLAAERKLKDLNLSCPELDEFIVSGEFTLNKWAAVLKALKGRLKEPEAGGILKETFWGGRLLGTVEEFSRDLNELYPEKPGKHGDEKAVLADLNDSPAAERLAGMHRQLAGRIDTLLSAMEFTPLFDGKRQLFSIGFNVEDGHLSKSYYDLLASEARQTSYIAIARGEVDQKHWFRLGRKLAAADGGRGLVSWTGTMFEYLMPVLLMKNVENTLLDETCRFIVEVQKKYVRHRKIPWGISESGYRAFDINLNYQYKAFGVPGLGLKRGLGNDRVIAPYASVLALGIDPAGVLANLDEFDRLGIFGDYGLYEAVDFTPARLDPGTSYVTVKSYMAHHQGMSLIALNNFIHHSIMQERFHSDPRIRSAELLLQERIPERSEFTREHADESLLPEKKSEQVSEEAVRTFGLPDTPIPRLHLLSNGSYSLMLSDGGSSLAKNNDMAVTRWSRDFLTGSGGMYVFVQNINSNNAWSTAFEPYNTEPERYRVVFSPDKAEFLRKDGNMETYTEITVSPEDNAEVRRISFTNHSNHSRVLEITSYLEAVLSAPEADSSHPAFSKLFVRTEFIREYECLLASRRHRTERQKPVWLLHVMNCEGEPAGDLQYETDRMKFIGRNRTLSNPAAMDPDQPLSNSVGPVLDPVLSLRRRIRLEPGQTTRISYVVAVAETRKNALELAEKYRDFKATERAFELSWTRSQVEARYLGLSARDVEFYLEMVPFLVFDHSLRRQAAGFIAQNTLSRQDLWPFGVSGDVPILLVSVQGRDDLDLVDWALRGHEYWRVKGFTVDLVLLVENESGYSQPVLELVREAAASGHARELLGRRGGVFVLSASLLNEEQIRLFYAAARLVVRDSISALKSEISRVMASDAPAGMGAPLIKTESIGWQGTAESIGRPDLEIINGPGTSPGREQESAVTAKYRDITVPPNHQDPAIPSQYQDVPDNTPGTQVICHTEVTEPLQFFNGIGGFTEDGREYVVHLHKGQHTPAPWSNVISNEDFGFIVTESGGGYTWAGNSRENKLTPWSNDPVSDMPGEIIYIRENDGDSLWSITPSPVRESGAYTIRHGFGYSIFEHTGHGIEQQLTLLAVKDEPVKLNIVKLKNITAHSRKLQLAYYLRPVLGVEDHADSPWLVSEMDESRRVLYMQNRFSHEFSNRIAFTAVSEPAASFTCDRREFVGINGSLERPLGLVRNKLEETTGAGLDTCSVLTVNVEIPPDSERVLVFLLGQYRKREEIKAAVEKYANAGGAEEALGAVKGFWKEILGGMRVNTPDCSMNILMNGWLLYQVIACRLWARSAFYQSGGAFGFRDQLQDVMAAAYAWPDLIRKQILLHASRQFAEGDVQHWWHKEAGRGIRTRYSDDLLWLPYVTCDYISHTGDYGILDEEAGYLQSEELREHEDERYEIPERSNEITTLYAHCTRAIDRSLRYGSHGIPLMGSGDWNDGMNTVGNKGRGESVWLGWFLHTILKRFIPVCLSKNDKKRAEKYGGEADKIAAALEQEAWDGSWYRRAYFDDGAALGSAANSECRIDSIAQSWSVISGAARPSRTREAMSAVEKYLVDYDEGIVKLLTPPFDEGTLMPGYIRGYVPGVRENGGQYTHAAAWVILGFARLGMGDKAWELFHMINPINHSRTSIEYSRYKVEPYVMAADVYAVSPNTGRGGWTWYTGAAGWLYRVALEEILGIKKEGSRLYVDPCIPSGWDRFEVIYAFDDSKYVIEISNPDRAVKGVAGILLDGRRCPEGYVELSGDGGEHKVVVLMGSKGGDSSERPEGTRKYTIGNVVRIQ